MLKKKKLITVDFSKDNSDNVHQQTFELKIKSKNDLKQCIEIQFPNHPNQELQYMCTRDFKTLGLLNNELNERFNLCQNFKIKYKDSEFEIINATGTLYIFWLEMLNVKNCNGINDEIIVNEPILVNKNGHHNWKQIYAFHLLKSFELKSTHFGLPEDNSTEIWCRESSAHLYKKDLKLNMMNEAELDTRIKSDINKNLIQDEEETEDFFNSSSEEDSIFTRQENKNL